MKWNGDFTYFDGDSAYIISYGQNKQKYVISGTHELFTEEGVIFGYLLTMHAELDQLIEICEDDDDYDEELLYSPEEEITECSSVMDCMAAASEHEIMYKLTKMT
jgi:hypothetical protein